MIWYKAWLESRTRFLIATALIAVVIGWAILDSESAMRRFDRHPPITFERYVSMVIAGRHLQLVWALAVTLLGAGGLLRESSTGSVLFTLSLPVPRRRWTEVRAIMGAIQSISLAMLSAVIVPLAAIAIGRSYPVWEALKFCGLLAAAGLVFFAIGLLCSALMAGEFSSIAVSEVGVYFVFTADFYFYRWIPNLGIGDLLGGGRLIDRGTGFLTAWPWTAVAISLCVAFALYRVAVEMMDRRDF
jgi:hypothetical protein